MRAIWSLTMPCALVQRSMISWSIVWRWSGVSGVSSSSCWLIRNAWRSSALASSSAFWSGTA